jgi:hypothetical protein
LVSSKTEFFVFVVTFGTSNAYHSIKHFLCAKTQQIKGKTAKRAKFSPLRLRAFRRAEIDFQMSKQQYPKKILVRLTEAEKQKIEESAKQSQLSVSRFLVRSGVGDERGLDPAERELREQAIYELRRVGVNLNQIAYALNAARRTGRGDDPSAPEIAQVAESLKAVLEAVKKAF